MPIEKKLINCVCPGVAETFASAFAPASMLSSDDFPTFDRPMNANSGSPETGHDYTFGALV